MKLKKYARALGASISMFTIIPMPHTEWDENGGGRMIAWFGVVGLLLGLIWDGVYLLLGLTNIGRLIEAVILVGIWNGLSGFLHLDGFMDVCDAVLSHRDLETKRKILKDPHSGSFGVISVVLFLTVEIASVYAIINVRHVFWILMFMPALTRSMTGLMLTRNPSMPGSSLGTFFKKTAGDGTNAFLLICAVLCVFGICFFGGIRLGLSLVAGVLAGGLVTLYVIHSLDGINGDVAGFCVAISEALAMMSLAFYI